MTRHIMRVLILAQVTAAIANLNSTQTQVCTPPHQRKPGQGHPPTPVSAPRTDKLFANRMHSGLPTTDRILDVLPPAERERLFPHVKRIAMPLGKVLCCDARKPLSNFPVGRQ